MRKIVYTRDGKTLIDTPQILPHEVGVISEEQAEQRALAKLAPDVTTYQWIEASSMPTDRIFRDAWKSGTGAIECDMVLAKAIALRMMGKASDAGVAAAKTPEELKVIIQKP